MDQGKDVTFVIDGVHDGRAWKTEDGVIAFRPTGKGQPELAKRALVDGDLVAIASPQPNPLAKGAYETRIVE